MCVLLHLGHRCSKLRLSFVWFFPLMNMKCPSSSHLITFGWKSILWQLLLVSWGHLLRKPFSILLLWDTFCLYYWGVFLVCSKMQDPACISSLLVCLFIGELSPSVQRDIKEKWLLLPIIFVVTGRIMFVWLSSFGFVERLLSGFFSGVVSLLVLVFSI